MPKRKILTPLEALQAYLVSNWLFWLNETEQRANYALDLQAKNPDDPDVKLAKWYAMDAQSTLHAFANVIEAGREAKLPEPRAMTEVLITDPCPCVLCVNGVNPKQPPRLIPTHEAIGGDPGARSGKPN